MGLEEGRQKKEDISEETDYQIGTLSCTKKTVKKSLLGAERAEKRPYAIMIDGAWGSGKSSFVKALEKLDQDEFIWIYAGSEEDGFRNFGDISDQPQRY